MNVPVDRNPAEATAELAKTLAMLTDRVRRLREEGGGTAETVVVPLIASDLGRYAQHLLRSRRVRDRALASERLVLGEPNWEMLLELFVADAKGEELGSTSLAIASQSSPTSGLRYIDRLVSHGLVTSTVDANDARRRMLSLSEHGRTVMAECLGAMLATEPGMS